MHDGLFTQFRLFKLFHITQIANKMNYNKILNWIFFDHLVSVAIRYAAYQAYTTY